MTIVCENCGQTQQDWQILENNDCCIKCGYEHDNSNDDFNLGDDLSEYDCHE